VGITLPDEADTEKRAVVYEGSVEIAGVDEGSI
jgi:hypothetical protein